MKLGEVRGLLYGFQWRGGFFNCRRADHPEETCCFRVSVAISCSDFNNSRACCCDSNCLVVTTIDIATKVARVGLRFMLQ